MKIESADLAFYVTIDELLKGGRDCEITKERPNVPYVKVLTSRFTNGKRGGNYVFFKDTKLAEECRLPARSPWESYYDYLDRVVELEPTIGLLNDALEKGVKLGIIRR